MNKRSKKVAAIFIILFFILGLITFSIIYIKSSLKPTSAFLHGEVCDIDETNCDSTPFIVDEGAYGKSTLVKLQEANIIKDAEMVYYWNKIIGGYSFYAGYYVIPHQIDGHDITLNELLAWLADPKNAHQDTVWVKLEEGDFARHFANVISESTTVKEKDLLEYWNSEEVIRGYMDEYPFLTEEIFNNDSKLLLEGYLFPDTYEFFEFTNEDEVTRRLLDRTLELYEDNIDNFTNHPNGLSVHQIFTLASICQWESGDEEDSKKVAGAFLNRMENPEFEGTGGKLQSTVTACYAFDLTKTECDNVGDTTQYTEQDHPYNTYTIEGLPPGPVCCPNEIAFNAALYPNQEGDYYFFVADMCNGGTQFARTYAQHQVNIDRYFLACD